MDTTCPSSKAALIQRSWRRLLSTRYCITTRGLRDYGRCVICQDEAYSVVRCSNGHPTCTGCSLSSEQGRCAVCRDVRNIAPRVDGTLKRCMDLTGLKLFCNNCRVAMDAGMYDSHVAWCPGLPSYARSISVRRRESRRT